jgi:hypothetical protein
LKKEPENKNGSTVLTTQEKENTSMVKIDLTRYKDLYFTGDIHGEFGMFTNSVTSQWGLSDCAVVVCGDIGMGFHKRGYYAYEFQRMQKKLAEKNITFVFLRGNHDDPEYFNKPEYDEFQYEGAYPNVYLVPDLTILDTCLGKVLCIGGAISIDRSMRTEGVSWWPNERMVMPTDTELEEISKESIDIVATHCCPLVCGPRFNDAMGFEKLDKFIMCELQNERLDFNDLLEKLKKDNPVKWWFYGHFHGHYSDWIDGVRFIGLDMIRQSGADLYKAMEL